MKDWPRISYEELRQTYERSLTTVLRGFRSMEQHEFLETWVPDDDHGRSLLNLIESAKDRGLPGLIVTLGPEIQRQLDLARLVDEVGSIARIQIKQGKDLAELQIEMEAKGALEIHPAFQEGVRRLLSQVTHEGALPSEEGCRLVSSEEQGTKLSLLVETASHRVRRAGFENPPNETQRGLLEGLCRMVEQRPILEGSDHGVLRLIEAVQSRSRPSPVAGILTVTNADPAFSLPLRLIRSLFAAYRQKGAFEETRNFYDDPVSPAWGRLTADQRAEQIRREVAALGSPGGLKLVRLDGSQRVIMEFEQPLSIIEQRKIILDLEGQLKGKLEPTLQIYLQPKLDENKPRQTKGVQL